MYWTSCCLHADQSMSKLHAPHNRLNGSGLTNISFFSDCNDWSCTPQFIKLHTTNVFYIITRCYWGRGTRWTARMNTISSLEIHGPNLETSVQFGSFESFRGTSSLLYMSGGERDFYGVPRAYFGLQLKICKIAINYSHRPVMKPRNVHHRHAVKHKYSIISY